MTYLRSALLGAAGLVLAATSALPVKADDWGFREIANEVRIGIEIAPVRIRIPRGVDPFSVYLGAYIVEAVATCNGCHSNKQYVDGHNPFLGQPKRVNRTCYLNGGQSFGPGIVSRNITPDNTGKPAGITFSTFVHLMRTGDDPQNPGTKLQVMPWDGFQNMTDTDLKAIYDYLSSIPSLPTGGSSPC